MGTRCLTRFIERDGTEIVVLYRQFDGYIEGHGRELTHFLAGSRVVNGYTSSDKEKGYFNGMSCLAASVVSHFKDKIGDFYLYPAGSSGMCEDYIYTVYIPDEELESGDTFSWADSEGTRGAKIHLRVELSDGETLHDACVDQLSVLWDAPLAKYDMDIEEIVRQSMAFQNAINEIFGNNKGDDENEHDGKNESDTESESGESERTGEEE